MPLFPQLCKLYANELRNMGKFPEKVAYYHLKRYANEMEMAFQSLKNFKRIPKNQSIFFSLPIYHLKRYANERNADENNNCLGDY